MGMFKVDDVGITVMAPLTWREPLWSRVVEIVLWRYRFVALLLIACAGCVWYIVETAPADVALRRVDNAFLGIFSFAVFFGAAVFIFSSLRHRKIKRHSYVADLVRSVAHVPRRWRREWLKSAGGDKSILNNFIISKLVERGITNSLEHGIQIHAGVYDNGRTMYEGLYVTPTVLSEEMSEVSDSLRSLGISYKSYPAAFILLLARVSESDIRHWDTNGVGMKNALGMIINGIKPEYVTGMTLHGIDTNLMDSLDSGSDFLTLVTK